VMKPESAEVVPQIQARLDLLSAGL
jgi:hypothetical protein